MFYFQSADKAEAIVGSANFTNGGLETNLEASIHVKGAADDAFFEQVRDQLARYEPLHLPITRKLADSYRRQSEAADKAPRPKNPVLPTEAKDWARETPASPVSRRGRSVNHGVDCYHLGTGVRFAGCHPALVVRFSNSLIAMRRPSS